ncbi:hypothetical protein [Pseudogracilibacillus sp. SO30301A]|uniref:hypothetical protein n=1 Tax=Pseudogracilibacillus sp. SO30301A TaxID=3098291 RepID=UPI00300DE1F3
MDKIYSTSNLENIYDDKNWEDILDDFQVKINYNLQKVHANDRDDLEQEIKLKIIEKINNLLEKSNTPGFWEFLSEM